MIQLINLNLENLAPAPINTGIVNFSGKVGAEVGSEFSLRQGERIPFYASAKTDTIGGTFLIQDLPIPSLTIYDENGNAVVGLTNIPVTDYDTSPSNIASLVYDLNTLSPVILATGVYTIIFTFTVLGNDGLLRTYEPYFYLTVLPKLILGKTPPNVLPNPSKQIDIILRELNSSSDESMRLQLNDYYDVLKIQYSIKFPFVINLALKVYAIRYLLGRNYAAIDTRELDISEASSQIFTHLLALLTLAEKELELAISVFDPAILSSELLHKYPIEYRNLYNNPNSMFWRGNASCLPPSVTLKTPIRVPIDDAISAKE